MMSRKIKNFRMYEGKFEDLIISISSSEFYEAYADYSRGKFTQKEIDIIKKVLPKSNLSFSFLGMKSAQLGERESSGDVWCIGDVESDYISSSEFIVKSTDEWFFIRIIRVLNFPMVKYYRCDQIDSLVELIKNPDPYFNI